MKNITVVGGGACGSAVFIELVIQILAEELQEKVSLTLIEKDKKKIFNPKKVYKGLFNPTKI